MKIKEIFENKKDFLELLFADEEEKMIDKYIEIGNMFAFYDENLKWCCIILKINEKTIEIKKLAIYEKEQKKGYGKALINFVIYNYKNKFERIIVGTGKSPLTLHFYEKCGFKTYDKIENLFLDNYKKPIYENGVLLKDMIYLEKFI